MGIQYPELPTWEFTVQETSAGSYRVVATRDGGVSGDSNGGDPEELLADLRTWAARVEADYERRAAK